MFRKNTASQFICFQGVDATTGGIKSGVTWTVRRCIDGTFAAGGGTVTEDSTNGWYKYAMSQADTNGNDISFNFTGSGAVPQTVNIVTTACDPTTATNFGITALPTTAVTTNASLLTSGTGTDQVSVSAGKVLLQATQSGVTIPTVTTVTNQLTAAAIATGIWQDTTAGDFTVASSIGKSLYTTGNAPGAASGLALVGSAMTLSASQHVIVDSGTVTTVTNQLTAAQIATGVWQDTTAGDFTVALSVGKSVMNGVSLGTGLTVNSLTNLPSIPANWLTAAGINAGALNGKGDWNTTTPPTAAAIATAVWTDTTGSDFTVLTSPGKIIFAQLGGTFTTTSSSVFTTAALANGPSGSGPTVQQIVNGVWDEPNASHLTAGSTGQKLNSAGGAADPLLNAVPGSYAAGTAGDALGQIAEIESETDAIKAKTDLLGSGQVVLNVPVLSGGSFRIRQNLDYFAAQNQSMDWTLPGTYSLVGATLAVKFTGPAGFVQTYTGSIADVNARTARLELSAAQTKLIPAGDHSAELLVTTSDGHTSNPLTATGNVAVA